jgi:uncharacterized protein (DUF2336 family)
MPWGLWEIGGVVSALALIKEVEDRVAQRPVQDRVDMLGKIIDLLRAQAVVLPKLQLDVFDAVIQRLSAEIELAARVELAEQLAPMSNAPEGIVRQLAHDQVPVAQALIANCAKLLSADLISIATSRGQNHMRAIAGRAHLASDVTDVLVVRGNSDVVSAVASNASARFSETGFNALIDRAKDDDAIRASISERAEMLHLNIDQIMRSESSIAEQNQKKRQAEIRDRLSSAMDIGIDKVLEEADATSGSTDADEQEAERLIIARTLNDEALARFAEDKRHRALVLAVAHLGKIELEAAERIMTVAEPKMLIFLLRSHNFTWATTRAVISARKATLPNITQMRRYMDVFNQTTPDVAKKVFKVRSAH